MVSLVRAHAFYGALALALALGSLACGAEPSKPSGPPASVAPPVMNMGPVMAAAGSGAAPVGPLGGSTAAPAGGGMAPDVMPPNMMNAPAAGSGGAPAGGESGSGNTTTPPATGSTDWTMMGYDLGSTYFNSAETVLTKQNAASLAVAYTVDMGGPVYGAPLQVGDKIYASGPGSVKALDAATGNVVWMASVASTSSMAYDSGKLYINNNAAKLVALDAANGNMLWSKAEHASQSADGSSSPLVVGDVILIGGSNGSLELAGGGGFQGYMSALDKMTGDIVWSTPTVPSGAKGASIWSSPSADPAAGVVFGATGNNYGAPATDSSDAILAFDLKTGAIKWKAQRVMNDTFGGGFGPDADFGANPVLYETMIDGVMTKVASAGNKGGSAHAVRRDTGELLWTRSLGSGAADGSAGIFVNSTWTGKSMLFACNGLGGATLYSLNAATGDIEWMRTLGGQVWGRMSVANGVGFVGTGTNLEVIDVDTGMTIKTIPSKGGTVAGTISISNGRVAFGEGLQWSSGRAGSTLTVLTVK